MSVLEKILTTKREEVTEAKRSLSLAELKNRLRDVPPCRPFVAALRSDKIAIIAEIKKASPSRGVLTHQFDHRALAKEYEQGGARALSVLTDESYFQGHIRHLQEAKAAVQLPVLRKDFILDPYQVYESRIFGADAILLIVQALPKELLSELYEVARSVGLDVLIETHTEEEIDVGNELKADAIGVNNRDLTTFDVHLQRSLELRPFIHQDAVTVSESGIRSSKDIELLRKAGFQAVLVGEALMSANNRSKVLYDLAQT